MNAAMTSTKNGYQKMLHVYLKRREELRTRCNGTGVMYRLQSRAINRKIKYIRQAIDRINKNEKKLSEIDDLIKEFTGVSVWHVGRKRGDYLLAKSIFYRHCLETGIRSRPIANYCGLKLPYSVVAQRRQFIKSFKHNEENRDKWYRWKKFVEERNEDFKEKFGELK